MYGNEEFREAVYGHLCKRDYILFLFEGMMDVEDSQNNNFVDLSTLISDDQKDPLISP